jgi:hypothetical protein
MSIQHVHVRAECPCLQCMFKFYAMSMIRGVLRNTCFCFGSNQNQPKRRLCFGLFHKNIKILCWILNHNKVELKQTNAGQNEDQQGKKR